ncbi:hypothetical protein G7Y89_g316 [Cudoniella acicularis]|uniref:Uncharacterized protein n=1 Tax=Cudoniella acicularis TaxID=354080 RepID=A0A8H4W8Z8_9HELO|nr:hypothetical protein G7Y89_g316 [Cudoniella acicularis]
MPLKKAAAATMIPSTHHASSKRTIQTDSPRPDHGRAKRHKSKASSARKWTIHDQTSSTQRPRVHGNEEEIDEEDNKEGDEEEEEKVHPTPSLKTVSQADQHDPNHSQYQNQYDDEGEDIVTPSRRYRSRMKLDLDPISSPSERYLGRQFRGDYD